MNIPAYVLGLCTLTAGDDRVMAVTLCRLAYEAQQREIVVNDDWTDERREWFYQKVRNVRWPK